MAERQITTLQGMVDQILPQLQSIRAADTVGDAERKRLGNRTALFSGLGCGAMFLSFFLMGLLAPVGVLLLLGGGVLLVIGIVTGMKKGKLDKLDLDNTRLQLANDLLLTLRPDLSEKRPVGLTMAHGEAVQHGTKTEEQKQGTWLTGQITTSEHEDEWLRLRGRFADGTIFRLEVTQETKRKSKPKRKYTKVRDRSREKIQLTLRVSQQLYPHLDRLAASLQPQLLMNHAGLQVLGTQVNGNVVRIAARTGVYGRLQGRYGASHSGQENHLNPTKVVGLLAFLYGGLTRCRAEAPANAPVTGSHIPPYAPGPAQA